MKNEYYEIIEKEETYKIVLKIITIVLLISLCLFAVYKFVIVNPKTVFKSGINNSFKVIQNVTKEFNNIDKPVAINGVLTMDSNDEKLYNIDKYKYNLDFGIDINNNKYNSLIGINYNNESKANILFQTENYNSYLTLPGIYDNIIKLNELNYNNIKISKLNSITNDINDVINKQINNNNLNESQETLNINDNSITYNYVELSLSKEELSKFISNFITDIKDNHRLFNDILEVLDLNENELNDYFDDIQKNIITQEFSNIKIRYYTKGIFAKIIGMKIIFDDKELVKAFNDNNLNLNINFNNYLIKIYNNDNKYYVSIIKDNNNYLFLIINQLKTNLIDIDYEYYDNKGIIHYELNKDHGNIKYSILNDKTYSINYDFNVINGKEVTNINKDNIVELKKLDEDDYLDIYNYFSKNFDDDFVGSLLTTLTEELLNY